MEILIIEPFYTGSHQKWVDGWKAHSKHNVSLLTLPGRHWKWRMHGAAITLANQFKRLNKQFDVVVANDLLDLALFCSLSGINRKATRIGVYFHENQLTYPWSPSDQDVTLQRDRHYAFINYTTCLAADFVWFNSAYHQNSFLNALPEFLRAFPDHQNLETVEEIRSKSTVMPLGMNLKPFQNGSSSNKPNYPVILWNHRWEYDKNPKGFHQLCSLLKAQGLPFELIICGEKYSKYPKIFDVIRSEFSKEVVHWGWAESKEEYQRLLLQANVLVVTSNQDFFGGSTVEAMVAGCRPYLPNRLAYPEHVPSNLSHHILYKEIVEVVDSLASDSWHLTEEQMKHLRTHIGRYDWTRMAVIYDQSVIKPVE